MPFTQTYATQPVISVFNDTTGGPSITFMHIEQLHITNCTVTFFHVKASTHLHPREGVIAPSSGLQPCEHIQGFASRPPVQDTRERREEQPDEPEGSWVSSDKGGAR